MHTVNIFVVVAVRTLPRAQFNVSTLKVNFAFHKLDALRIMVLTIMACALVVSSNRRLNFLVRSYKNVSIDALWSSVTTGPRRFISSTAWPIHTLLSCPKFSMQKKIQI